MNVRIWSKEQEEELLRLYCEEETSIEDIADHFEKNHRSIISKLVQLKAYKKPQTDKKAKKTVKSMIRELENILGVPIDGINLSKKSNLETLVTAIKNKLDSI